MNYHQPNGTTDARAFLRWAGGKSWLVPRLDRLFGGLTFERYHEPFLGGGSFFFAAAAGRRASLSDKNESLIATYKCLRDAPYDVISALSKYENTPECYYEVRSKILSDDISNAAKFIYLNQTSFNGIYRVNLRGEYNVPFGYRSKNFLEEDVLLQASLALRNAELEAIDFEDALNKVGKGDLAFIDPPYTVSHNNNGFIKYNQSLFRIEDQRRLRDVIADLQARGGYFIMTNAAHAAISEIFDLDATKVELSRASLIGGKKAQRGPVAEYMFTNLKLATDDYT